MTLEQFQKQNLFQSFNFKPKGSFHKQKKKKKKKKH